MIAGDRDERLNTLAELVKWARVETTARDRREHRVAKEAGKRMREVVAILGFDPLEYECERDAVAMLINRRSRALIAHMPGTSAELARKAGIPVNDVHAYLRQYVARGEVRSWTEKRTTYWEVVT